MAFPKVLYVTEDGQDDDKFLVPHEDESASETDGDKVAIYQLKEVKTLRLITKLE